MGNPRLQSAGADLGMTPPAPVTTSPINGLLSLRGKLGGSATTPQVEPLPHLRLACRMSMHLRLILLETIVPATWLCPRTHPPHLLESELVSLQASAAPQFSKRTIAS